MQTAIRFDQKRLPAETEDLRRDVRAFLADEISRGTFDPGVGLKQGSFDRDFSRRVGERGWIGMTWPKEYGGREMTHLDRYVVTEEMRAVTAPTWCHFVADRQSGPVILKYGTEEMKQRYLPPVASGGRYDALTARLGDRAVPAVGAVLRPGLMTELEAGQ